MAEILEANKVDLTQYEHVLFTNRVKLVPLDDVTGAIRAIIDDWGRDDVLTAKTTPALMLADLVFYMGLNAAEALGPELAGKLKERGAL